MDIDLKALSDVGQRRELNEDSYGISEKQGLIIVCDGMGGHSAGEIASQMAVETIIHAFKKLRKGEIDKICEDIKQRLPGPARRLVAAVRLANFNVIHHASQNVEHRGMGTTVVAFLIKNKYFIAAHVGDSRLYRFSDNELKQVTQDHSWVNELVEDGELDVKDIENFGRKNVITRALGIDRSVKIDLIIDSLVPSDRFLLCSDGLSGPASDIMIKTILSDFKDNEEALEKLIDKANENGGPDNITAALATVSKVNTKGSPIEKVNSTITYRDDLVQNAEALALHKIMDESLADLGIQSPKKSKVPILVAAILVIGALLSGMYFLTPILKHSQNDEAETQTQTIPPDDMRQQNDAAATTQAFGTVSFISLENSWIDQVAQLYVDGEDKGILYENKSNLKLPIGSHKIEIRWNENDRIMWTVNIQKGDDWAISIDERLNK